MAEIHSFKYHSLKYSIDNLGVLYDQDNLNPRRHAVEMKKSIEPYLEEIWINNFPGSLNIDFKHRFVNLSEAINLTDGRKIMPNSKNEFLGNKRLKRITENKFKNYIATNKKNEDYLFFTDGL